MSARPLRQPPGRYPRRGRGRVVPSSSRGPHFNYRQHPALLAHTASMDDGTNRELRLRSLIGLIETIQGAAADSRVLLETEKAHLEAVTGSLRLQGMMGYSTERRDRIVASISNALRLGLSASPATTQTQSLARAMSDNDLEEYQTWLTALHVHLSTSIVFFRGWHSRWNARPILQSTSADTGRLSSNVSRLSQVLEVGMDRKYEAYAGAKEVVDGPGNDALLWLQQELRIVRERLSPAA